LDRVAIVMDLRNTSAGAPKRRIDQGIDGDAARTPEQVPCVVRADRGTFPVHKE
jgi:hypothetical protein